MFTLLSLILGGVGLFLIGIDFMRRGFHDSAGSSLRRILSEHTDKLPKALFSGFVVSTATQSASAVILALIGFVNAGVFRLKQAIDVVFGANLGKVATAWIITAVGFKFNVTAYALPLLGIGALIRVLFKNHQGTGTALVGFGLIFLALATLKESFEGAPMHFGFLVFPVPDFFSVFLYLLIGVAMTVIMQSSAAALAITFSALMGGLISIGMAAAMIIGLNLGTTSSAILAAYGTTPVAKRITAAHVVFNLICTVIAYILLQILFLTNGFTPLLSFFGGHQATALTAFYSVYIFLSLIIMIPFRDRFEKFLLKKFHKAQTLGSPRFIDRGKAYHPKLAIEALHKEVIRFGKISGDMLLTALHWENKKGWIYGVDLSYEERELDRLVQEIYAFSSRTARKQSSTDITQAVQSYSLAVRYFEDAADTSKRITKQFEKMTEPMTNAKIFSRFNLWANQVRKLVGKLALVVENGDLAELKNLKAAFTVLEDQRTELRQGFLDAGIAKEIDSAQTIVFIDLIDKCRRAIQSQMRGIQETWEVTLEVSDVTALKDLNL